MEIYAVKIGKQWSIATLVEPSRYGDVLEGDAQVWSEMPSTAAVGRLGEEASWVLLETIPVEEE